MSIIEQTLHKLEDVDNFAGHHTLNDEFSMGFQKKPSAFRRFFYFFVLPLGIVTLSIYFIADYTSQKTQQVEQAPKQRFEVASIQREQQETKTTPSSIKEVAKTEEAATPSQWIENGWRWYENLSLHDAIGFWEEGFEQLPDDTGIYIGHTSHYSERAVTQRIRENTDPTRFFVRWPLHKGNQVMELCIQPAYIVVTKSHCSHTLVKEKQLVLKSDLSIAFYMMQQKAKETPVATVRKPQPKAQRKAQEIRQPKKTQPVQPQLQSVVPQQLAMGNYQSVLDVLAKQRLQLANAWEYYYWQSLAYAGLGQFEEAEKALDLGLRRNHHQAVLFIQKGLLAQERGEHRKAIEIFRKAEGMKNTPASLFLNMGYSAAVLGDTLLATNAYRRFLSMTNDSSDFDPSVRQQVKNYLAQIR